MLKSIYLGFRKVKVQRVTVVKFGMYNRGGDGVGCLEVKVGANAAQLTNVIVAGRPTPCSPPSILSVYKVTITE